MSGFDKDAYNTEELKITSNADFLKKAVKAEEIAVDVKLQYKVDPELKFLDLTKYVDMHGTLVKAFTQYINGLNAYLKDRNAPSKDKPLKPGKNPLYDCQCVVESKEEILEVDQDENKNGEKEESKFKITYKLKIPSVPTVSSIIEKAIGDTIESIDTATPYMILAMQAIMFNKYDKNNKELRVGLRQFIGSAGYKLGVKTAFIKPDVMKTTTKFGMRGLFKYFPMVYHTLIKQLQSHPIRIKEGSLKAAFCGIEDCLTVDSDYHKHLNEVDQIYIHRKWSVSIGMNYYKLNTASDQLKDPGRKAAIKKAMDNILNISRDKWHLTKAYGDATNELISNAKKIVGTTTAIRVD